MVCRYLLNSPNTYIAGTRGTCFCTPQWTGLECEVPAVCSPNPCEPWQRCTTISAVTDLHDSPDDVIAYLSSIIMCLGSITLILVFCQDLYLIGNDSSNIKSGRDMQSASQIWNSFLDQTYFYPQLYLTTYMASDAVWPTTIISRSKCSMHLFNQELN